MLQSIRGHALVDEVDAEEVQYHAPKDVVRKRSAAVVSITLMCSAECKHPYLSCDILSNSALFSAFVCIRKLAVSTNCPTVAEKPDRKALNGYSRLCQLLFNHSPE